MTDATIVEDIVRPFVEEGVYRTEEDALRNLRNEIIEEKIEENREEIKEFREKYGKDFEEFTEDVKEGDTSIDKEDDWMRWEAARNMLEKWESVQERVHAA
ncbi:MAG: hypothetical protein MUP63_01425 [Candidatus Nanohaloarchaeota archaeon QJJ-7]|nr:hypothetical protein [Candidatus Nanohaloarchaeota archaeon QJJ-7]MDY6773571.1 hypothetical protein [Candidatus Nanohaloarchaea archaeon]